jgi:hypothetical protein
MDSLTAYVEYRETEGGYKRKVLENIRNKRPLWEIALDIIHRAGRHGEAYEAIKSKAAKSPYLGREELTDENLGLSLSLLQKQKLIRCGKRTQRYSTVPGKPLPLR